jgi:predicted nucleic acid-binding protein
MTFVAIPQNASVFIDANTFVYHFSLHPALALPCQELLDRVFRKELVAFTSTHVLNDVAHRLMTMEAATTFGWTGPGITQRLRRHPAEIQKLTRFRQAIQQVPHFGVQVVSIPPVLVETATSLRLPLSPTP